MAEEKYESLNNVDVIKTEINVEDIKTEINVEIMSEFKTNENNDKYTCYCGKTIKNNKQIIREHNKSKKHLNYDPDKVDNRTYYQKHREEILSKIRTEEYKKKQKLYQQNYYQENREERIKKIKENDCYRKYNVYQHCKICKCLYKKYNLSKHKNCENYILSRYCHKKYTYSRCVCGDIINITYISLIFDHLKSKRHKILLKYLFNIKN